MKVLIATWGYPFTWGFATYNYKGRKVTAKTTLPVLINSLKPNKVYVIATDTVLVRPGEEGQKDREALRDIKTYGELKNRAKTLVEDYIKKNVVPLLDDKSIPIEVVVNYNSGTYNNFLHFKRTIEDYYRKLFEIFREIFAPYVGQAADIDLYLDITHGINYMPAFAFDALKDFAKILSVNGKVNLTVLNSEPYPQPAPRDEQQQKNIHLSVYEVFKETYQKDFIDTKIDTEGVIPTSDFNRQREVDTPFKSLEKLATATPEEERDVYTFLVSALEGYPLAVTQFFIEPQRLEQKIKETVEDYEGHTKVTHRVDGQISVKSENELSKHLPVLVFAWILAKFIEKRYNGGLNREVSLRELFGLKNTLYKRNSTLEIFLTRNLKDFENQHERGRRKKISFYGEHLPKDMFRHFKAHSGLIFQFIDQIPTKEGYVYRYKPEEEERVKKLILKSHS